MFLGSAKGYTECALQRAERQVLREEIQRPDHDRQWRDKLERLPSGG
jgi:hypothetical protein